MIDLAAPRWPDVAAGKGHYESFYLTARHPREPQAAWIRHTVHQRPGKPPTASVWFVLFEAGRPPLAGKATVGADALHAGHDPLIRIGDCAASLDRVAGRLASPTVDASWDLRLQGSEPPVRHLPSDRLYATRLPRTKTSSPRPGVRVDGELVAGNRTIACDGWRGVLGHNWGAEHAARWIWMHAPLPGDGWLDVALGRVRVGRWTTPWIATGALRLDGRVHAIGGPRRARGTHVDEHPTRCAFTLPGDGVTLRGEIGAPADRFVAWRYADPSGGEHHTANCSIADLGLVVQRSGRGAEDVPLELPGAAVYELGMHETDHGLPLQPYADG